MFEFLSVVDATHDDPTFYPTLSAPNATYPFEWEVSDGGTPQVFTTRSVVVLQHSGRGWSQVRRLKDINFTVVVTEARVVIYCEKFDKGGGWRGFGVGGLAVALVANAVSHARAAARRRGKLLVGQVRYDWLAGVDVPTDKHGRATALRLMVDAGTFAEPRPLALDLMLKERFRPDAWAGAVAAVAANHRLASGMSDEAQRPALDLIASGRSAAPMELPGWTRVGAVAPPNELPAATANKPLPVRPAAADDAAAITPEPPANPEDCPACGASVMPGASACGRCGNVLQPSVATASPSARTDSVPDPNMTTARSTLTAPKASTAPAPAAPPPVEPLNKSQPAAPVRESPPPPFPAPRPVAPPEVWTVSACLVVLAALAIYPVLRYIGPVIPELFGGTQFSRALAALLVEFGAILAACGIALLLLAVGLVRGSRVAQLMTCVVTALVAIGEVIGSQSSEYRSPAVSTGIAVGSVVIATVTIMLVAGSPNARRFFERDERVAGVVIGGVANAYLGSVAVLDGILLMIAGALSSTYVWIGLAFAVAGLGLLIAGVPLRNGNRIALAVTLCLHGAFIVVLLVLAHKFGELGTPSTLVPIGLSLAAVAGLTVPVRSREYFTSGARSSSMLRRRAAGSTMTLAATALLVLVIAGVGFSEAHSASAYSASPVVPLYAPATDSNVAPVASSPTTSYIGAADAASAATAVMQALEGSGSANVCNGAGLPTIDVYDYRLRDVSPQTAGTFTVTADVGLHDGTYESVSYIVTGDGSGTACADATSFVTRQYSPDNTATNVQPAVPTVVPSDVPSVPSTGDPVPTNAPLPTAPSGSVIAYGSDTTPSNQSELVQYTPTGLDSDQRLAVQAVIAFMTYINQQDFQSAWNFTTYRLRAPTATAAFGNGYATSRFFQVEFGQPERLARDLMVVPGRFVSKQDPAAQGNPSGVTTCSYWPQYMFTLAKSGGRWRIDVAGIDAARPELDNLKRQGSGGYYLNPVAQREDCS